MKHSWLLFIHVYLIHCNTGRRGGVGHISCCIKVPPQISQLFWRWFGDDAGINLDTRSKDDGCNNQHSVDDCVSGGDCRHSNALPLSFHYRRHCCFCFLLFIFVSSSLALPVYTKTCIKYCCKQCNDDIGWIIAIAHVVECRRDMGQSRRGRSLSGDSQHWIVFQSQWQ